MGVLGVLNNGFRVSFEDSNFLFTTSLLKSKSGQASRLTRGTLCQTKSATFSNTLRKTTRQLPQNAMGLSAVTNFFFSPVNSHLQKSRSFPQLSEFIDPSATDTEHFSQNRRITEFFLVKKDSLFMAK